MASGAPNNPSFNAESGQAQMRRDDLLNQPSDIHSQGQAPNFLQETGNQVTNIVQGAADVGKGAAQGAVSLARGAALGAANMAQGAADAVKNTFGMNTSDSGSTTGTTNAATAMGGTTYPSAGGNNPSNPNTRV